MLMYKNNVVIDTTKIQLFKQITTARNRERCGTPL